MIPSRVALRIRIRGNRYIYWPLVVVSKSELMLFVVVTRGRAWISARVDGPVKFRDVGDLGKWMSQKAL